MIRVRGSASGPIKISQQTAPVSLYKSVVSKQLQIIVTSSVQHSAAALYLIVVDLSISGDDDPLLDAGLRNPSLHRLLKVRNKNGQIRRGTEIERLRRREEGRTGSKTEEEKGEKE